MAWFRQLLRKVTIGCWFCKSPIRTVLGESNKQLMRGLLKPFLFLCEKPVQLFDEGRNFLGSLSHPESVGTTRSFARVLRGSWEFPFRFERTIIKKPPEQTTPKCAKALAGCGVWITEIQRCCSGSVASRGTIRTSAQFHKAAFQQGFKFTYQFNCSSSELVAMMLRQSCLICCSKFIVARYNLATSSHKIPKSALHNNTAQRQARPRMGLNRGATLHSWPLVCLCSSRQTF